MSLNEYTARSADSFAVRTLLDTYHAAINFRDLTLLPRIFAPDAVWDAPAPIGLRHEGIEAIEAGFRDSVGRQAFLYQASSGVAIEWTGEKSASVRSMMLEIGSPPDGPAWAAVVTFDDRAMLGEQGWRLTHRTVLLQRAFGLTEPAPG